MPTGNQWTVTPAPENPENPAAPAPGVSKAEFKKFSPHAAPEMYIAVMGETGTGKSSFINLVTGNNLKVGHKLSACTEAIQTASTIIDGTKITFIDTPGTDDISMEDSGIIHLLDSWLEMSHSQKRLLNGVIFFRRITDNRIPGSIFRTLHHLKKICGTINFQRFALVATMWDLLPTEEEGEIREREWKQGRANGWTYMITKGAQAFRHYGKRDTAMEVAKLYLPKNSFVLDLQEQLSNNVGSVGARLYQALSFERLEIRLLSIHTSDEDTSPLSCSLNQVALLKAPPFVALSYCWGDLNEKVPIMVNDLEVFVTVNLYAALRRLRAARIECAWVDFLCINQENSEERSLQIRRMGTIYNEAKQVVVWLGDDEDIEEDDILSLSTESAKMPHTALSFSARRAFIQLLSRPYWTRIWIIQELASASSIIVLYGRHKLPWELFSNNSRTEFVAPVDETASSEFETKFQKICHFRTDRRDGNPIRLLEALYRSQSALSTDPRDKIYALLGLVFDSHRFVPEPNYNLSKEETYTNFSLALIKCRLPLDFIYLRTSNRQIHDSLPSWVVDWSDLNDALAREEFRHIMESVLPAFSTTRFNEQNQPHGLGSTLMIRGSIHGTIDGLSSAFCTGESDSAMNSVFSPEKGAGSAPKDFDCSSYIFNAILESRKLSAAGILPPPSPIKLWSSITRNKLGVLFDGSLLPTELKRLLDWFDESRSLAAFGRTMEYWESTWTSRPCDADWGSQQTACLRSLVRTIMSGMRIAIFETGELGWVHPQSRKGDKVAKIFGCDRHVVLRPHSKGYRVIGEARPYWFAGKPELSDKAKRLTIF